MKVVVVQTCVPDYRLGLFTAIAKITKLVVASGPEYFEPSIRNAAGGQKWSLPCDNRFLLGRRLAWLGTSDKLQVHDTVVVHEWNPRIISFWRVWATCRWRGIPIVLWGHAWGKGGPRGLMFRLRHGMARFADGVICYTESQAALTRKMVSRRPVLAAPNACLRRADCGVFGDEGNRSAVIYVGRIVGEKKVGLLIQGFAAACRADTSFDARLLIVGDGPERPQLEGLADELGIAARVSWLGHQSDVAILRAAYGQAFVSVSPGYVGLSLTQSFAFGVPALIAKDEPHSPEIEAAREGVNARFFASDDAVDLTAKLLGAWKEWRGIEGQRRELAAWTAESYSFEKMADRFIEICRRVSDHMEAGVI